MKFTIQGVAIFLLLIYSPAFSQEEDEESLIEDPLERYSATLEFGIEASVITIIKELRDLKIAGFENEILERILNTKNIELGTEGLSYLRDMESDIAIDFAIETLLDYDEQAKRAVQFSIFYLSDNVEALEDAQRELIKQTALDILNSDDPALSLSILEIIPSIYSEKEIAYKEKNDEVLNYTTNSQQPEPKTSLNEAKTNNTVQALNVDSNKEETQEKSNATSQAISTPLYSSLLWKKYESSKVAVIKNEIIITLGKIQALNQISLIEEIATDNSVSSGLRTSAIIALSSFENITESISQKIEEIFKKNRLDSSPIVRLSMIEALEASYLNVQKPQYLSWIGNALQDNDSKVRTQALRSLHNIYSKNLGLNNQKKIFRALEYMIQFDPEIPVRQEAIKTIAAFDSNSEFILSQIKAINFLNPTTKSLIDISLRDYADKGGVDILVDLLKDENRNLDSSVLEYISQSMSKSDSEHLTPLFRILLASNNSKVVSNTINAIARNKSLTYQSDLERIENDFTQSTSVRNQAKKAIKTISNNSEE